MEELRRLCLQFVSHKSLTSQEFALAVIELIAAHGSDEKKMLAVAERFWMAPEGRDD